MKRVQEVDVLRGTAVVLMLIYHLFFDLYFFSLADIDLYGVQMVIFQRIVGTMFLMLVGISLVLSESRNKEGYSHHAKRAARLGSAALLITLATWIYSPEGFIRFGVIHMIAVSTLIAPFFLRFGKLNVALGAMLILAGIRTHYTDIGWLFWLGPIRHDYMAFDHYPLVPWFGVVLIGLELGKRIESWKGFVPDNRMLSLLGRNSLLIYLIHQPLLIALLLLSLQIF